jgi:RecA/RadA recombinase
MERTRKTSAPENRTAAEMKAAVRSCSAQKETRMVPTGSTLLNLAVSDDPLGGWRLGGIVNIIGDSHTGKSLLALTLCAEACRSPITSRHRIYYDDVEAASIVGGTFNVERLFGKKTVGAIKPAWPKPKGRSEGLDEWEAKVLHLIDAGHPFIYIIDSLDGLLSSEDQKIAAKLGKTGKPMRDGEKKQSLADRARKMSSALRRISGKIERTSSLLVVISQTREAINSRFKERVRAGGRALEFYSSHVIWIAYQGKIKKNRGGVDYTVGRSIRIKSTKSRITGREREADLLLYPEYGVDDIGSLVDWMVKIGAWPSAGRGNAKTIQARGLGMSGSRETIILKIERQEKQAELAEMAGAAWDKINNSLSMGRHGRYA